MKSISQTAIVIALPGGTFQRTFDTVELARAWGYEILDDASRGVLIVRRSNGDFVLPPGYVFDEKRPIANQTEKTPWTVATASTLADGQDWAVFAPEFVRVLDGTPNGWDYTVRFEAPDLLCRPVRETDWIEIRCALCTSLGATPRSDRTLPTTWYWFTRPAGDSHPVCPLCAPSFPPDVLEPPDRHQVGEVLF